MQLTAKLLTVLPLQTGNGKNGDWKKQDSGAKGHAAKVRQIYYCGFTSANKVGAQ
jgi:hypothetical protein